MIALDGALGPIRGLAIVLVLRPCPDLVSCS